MKKIRVKIIIVFLFIVILGIVLFFYYNNNRNYVMKEKNSFSEGNIMEGSFSEEECENINDLLAEKLYEGDIYCGFYGKSGRIDLQSTLYGILLADKSGFQYNKEKLQNFINQNYQLIEESRDTSEITNYLYYTIILDQIANNFNVNYNSNFIQEKIDFVLKNTKYGTENEAESIEETRKILEIIMDLQIHNVDVHITEKQRKKISKGLKSCWNREELKNSFLITDMYIISDILKLDIVKPDDFIQVHNLLLSNGGNKMKKDESMAADIFTTYKFEVCLERMNDYTCLEDKKQFVESLKIKEGIYCLYDDSEDMLIDLASVLYGNTICKREIGGDKFDFNKSY